MALEYLEWINLAGFCEKKTQWTCWLRKMLWVSLLGEELSACREGLTGAVTRPKFVIASQLYVYLWTGFLCVLQPLRHNAECNTVLPCTLGRTSVPLATQLEAVRNRVPLSKPHTASPSKNPHEMALSVDVTSVRIWRTSLREGNRHARFFLIENVKTGYGVTPASWSVCTRGVTAGA